MRKRIIHTVDDKEIDMRIRDEIQKVFPPSEGIERIFFPEKSGQIPDRPVITMIVMGQEQSIQETQNITDKIKAMAKEYGKSARTFKSALLWIVPETSELLREEARKLIAWEDIKDEGLNLDESQQKQLNTNIQKAKRDLTESVWRTYRHLLLLDKDNKIKEVDLGPIHSSAAESLTKFILNRLRQSGDVEKEISPRFLVRNWPPVFTEWSTKDLRDVFYASPLFPRLTTLP